MTVFRRGNSLPAFCQNAGGLFWRRRAFQRITDGGLLRVAVVQCPGCGSGRQESVYDPVTAMEKDTGLPVRTWRDGAELAAMRVEDRRCTPAMAPDEAARPLLFCATEGNTRRNTLKNLAYYTKRK